MNHGFIEVLPQVRDFVLGSTLQSTKVILSTERSFASSLPVVERQARPFETFSCVSFSALNNLEIIYKRQFGTELNFSDRYLASMSGTVPGQGNNFTKVGDTLRKVGAVMEGDYPWGGSNNAEYLIKPGQQIVEKGKALLTAHEIQYEWVGWGGCRPDQLYEALQYGPLQVSVDSDATRTKQISTAVNHAVTIYESVKGSKFGIFDHYDGFTYDVPWNFYFGSALQYSLLKKKFLPLVMVYGKPEIYAIVGTTAQHIGNEATWHYGESIGLWEKKIEMLTQNSFNNAYTLGKQLIIK